MYSHLRGSEANSTLVTGPSELATTNVRVEDVERMPAPNTAFRTFAVNIRSTLPAPPNPSVPLFAHQNFSFKLDMHQMHHPLRSPPTHIDTSRLDSSHTPPTHPGVAATASRFFFSMRKSFSQPLSPRRKNIIENQRAVMYSTPEERHAHNTSRASPSRYLDSRPTIEQIAMGLHVSRTPHLRPVANPLQRHSLPSPSPRRNLNASSQPPRASPDNIHDTSSSSSQYRTHHSLPPPPSRSSMKRTSPSASTLIQPQQQFLSSGVSPSTSTVTSGGPVPPGSSRPLSSLRVRMSKFIPGYRPLSLPSSLGRASSFTSSTSDSTRPATPRKAVRFSTSVLAIDEQPS